MNEKEICEFMTKIPTFEGSKPIYNPMETFVECVSQKEICHSSILADLLNPLGRHGLGRSFLDVFLKEIGCESFKDVTIRTEMPVLRILTDGYGPRRIDICIINNNDVVIIENKLNNAQEQQCQLADYKAGLKHEGFNVVKTVCLQGSNPNDIGADIDLSIMHLASLLDKVCGNCFELKSYIALLKNMGRKERMKEEVEKLLSLNNDTKDNPFAKVRDISRLFYNDEVSEYCFNEIMSSFEKLNKDCLKLIFQRKDPGYFNNERCTFLQIWNQYGYEKGRNSGYWIELWFFDYSRFEIWIKGNSKNNLEIVDYDQDVSERDYYKHRNGVKSFPFPGDDWNTTMIDEIWKLIKELYSDMIKP